MTILIGRSAGPLGPRVTFTSTTTGDDARMSPDEWIKFVRRVKAGQLDHIEQVLRTEQAGVQ